MRDGSRRPVDAAAASAGAIVVVACAVAVRDGSVGSTELAVFRAINGLTETISPAMQALQLLGILMVGPLVAAIAAALRRWRLALACLLVTAGKLLAERTVWELVARSRPGTTIPDAIVRGDAPSVGAAFVSGHVVLLTGLAWVSTPYLRGRWRVLPWAIVVAVGLARIYLGAHAPLDVVGGVGLGLLVGGLANLTVGVDARVAESPPAAVQGRGPENDQGGSR